MAPERARAAVPAHRKPPSALTAVEPLRVALRWLRRHPDHRDPPPSVQAAVAALLEEAVALVRYHDAHGWRRPHRIELCGVRFEAQCTTRERLLLYSPRFRVTVSTPIGAL